jgi:DNA-binding response OmpR family regulator
MSGGPLPRDEDLEGPRLLILLAERDPYAAEFAEFFLRTEGYEVVLALDASEAERTSQDRRPDLAVVEILISGGTGGELCRRLKEGGVPSCLAISSLQAQEDALAGGADAFLQKPLEPLRFVSTVKDLLGRSAFLRDTRGRRG